MELQSTVYQKKFTQIQQITIDMTRNITTDSTLFIY